MSPIFLTVCNLCLAAMFVTGLMCLYRIVIGPKAVDRAVALDMLSNAFIGIICVLCVIWFTDQAWYFDAVWILTLVGFIGSASIARYLEQGKVF